MMCAKCKESLADILFEHLLRLEALYGWGVRVDNIQEIAKLKFSDRLEEINGGLESGVIGRLEENGYSPDEDGKIYHRPVTEKHPLRAC